MANEKGYFLSIELDGRIVFSLATTDSKRETLQELWKVGGRAVIDRLLLNAEKGQRSYGQIRVDPIIGE